MRKITLLLFAFICSFTGYSQGLPLEGFEGTTFPPTDWAVFDIGVGGTVDWSTNPNSCQGTLAAYMNRQNIAQGVSTEEYLSTPSVLVPVNGELRFFSRTFTAGNSGTTYEVKLAPGTSNQNLPASYTTTLATYTEDELSAVFNVCDEKVINLAAYAGQNVYIAFVMKYTQPSNSLTGDRWLLDNVQVVEKCLDPAGLAAAPQATTSTLSWTGTATTFEIEHLVGTTPPTGVPTGTSTTNTFNQTGLLPTTNYCFYVRAVCSASSSAWVGPICYTTSALPPVCGGNYVDSGGTTGNYTNGENITVTICPTVPGDVVTVTFTAFNTEPSFDGIYVYNANSVLPAAQIASPNGIGFGPMTIPGAFWGTAIPGPFVAANPSGCLTFNFRSDGSVVRPGWIANITCGPPPTCPNPNGLSVNGITSSSVNATWTSNSSATTFNMIAVPAGSPAPNAGTTGYLTSTTNTNALVNGLLPDTCYDIYVRDECGPGDFSSWISVLNICTTPTCPRPTNLVASGITLTNATLQWTSNSTALTWHVLALPCGSPAPDAGTTGFLVATTNPFLITGLSPATCYTLYVRGVCSDTDLSNWSTGININTQLVPPACGGTFTDPGGASGNYANNLNVTTVICPDNATDLVTVTFLSFATEGCCDDLLVYEGSGTGGTLLGSYAGTAIPPEVTSAVPGGCLTFVFISDGSVTAAGWVANVTCGPAPTCPKPTNLVASAVTSTTASLLWTNNSTATTWHVLALPCGSPAPDAGSTGFQVATTNPFLITGLSPDTCYTLYVRNVCSDTDLSNWSVGINITTQQVPPACGGTFTDPGGSSANYGNNANVTTTICPPGPLDLVTVTFLSFSTEACCDDLMVYEGNGTGGTLLGTFAGNAIPPEITSSVPGGCLTFVFTSDGSVTAAGWVANVTCGPAPTCSKPIGLTAIVLTSTSAALSWTQPLNPDGSTATTWEVIVQPAGTGTPTAGSVGTIVTAIPYTATGLTPGTNYEFWVRAVCSDTDSSPWAGPSPFFTQISCGDSQPFCGDTGLTYTNVTGAPSYGSIDCLFTTPNPNWYFMNVNEAGNLTFQIAQTNNGGGGIDVDFVCWGPFNSNDFSIICGQLYDYPDGNIGVPDNVIACSYSAAPIENFTIPNAQVGQFYIVLITNFSNQPGTVSFVQTNNNQTGAGGTSCDIVCDVDLGNDQVLCNQTSYTITSTNENADGYTWFNGTTQIPGEIGSTLIVTQSGTYTCVVTCGLNTAEDSVVITFNAPVVPTFAFTTTVCQGLPAPILPLSSTNTPAITGTWNPTSIDTSVVGTTTYTFTPDAGQCASVTTVDVAVVAASVVSTFDPIANICQGLPAPTLPTSSTNVPAVTGTWNPSTIDTSVVGTVTYTFTPNAGQCATVVTLDVTIDAPSIVPTFTPIANICQDLAAPTLPTSSTNSITGTWNPSTIDTSVVGTVTYTFTPTAGQCAIVTTLDVTIDAPSIVPTFTPIANICQDLAAPTLPTSSTNSITGTWNPSTIDTSVVGTVTYTFTPTAGQCATVTTLDVIIDAPSIVPTFTPIASICQDLVAPSLPTSSTNSITGTWNPSTIDTSIVGTITYTFTPAGGQCAIVTTLDVTIDAPSIVPTFTPIANICLDNAAPTLPTTSTNSITGSWNPSTIDTSVAGTVIYTFTPNTGQCATTTTLNVTIDSPNIVPTFNGIGAICLNSTAPTLPTTSINSITGSWFPSTIDTSVAGSVTYTFTPDPLQCAVSTTLSVTVNAAAQPLFTQLGPYCQGATAVVFPTTSNDGIVGSWSSSTIDTSVAGTFIYTFTPDAGYCATQVDMTIIINVTPDVAPINDVDACDAYTLPTLVLGNYYSSPNGVNPITNLTLTTSQTVYVFAQTTGTNCSDEESFVVTITDSPEFMIEGDCIGPVFTLTVVPTAGSFPNDVEYSWSNGTSVVGTNATLEVLTMGDYTCTVTFPGDFVDCDSSVTFSANDIFCIIPKGISPNGDGMNDFFNLSGFNVTQLNIYNRYGTIAYSKAGYVNEWAGQSDKGEELPDGTYYYVIERADAETKTGWVYINRNAN